MQIVIAAGRSIDKLEAAKTQCGSVKGTIDCKALNLSDYDSIEAFVADVKQSYPNVQVLINNAGAIPGTSYKESKYGLESTFQANFVSTVLLTEMLLPLIDTDGGRFIHVSSLSHAEASKPVDWSVIPSTAETFGGYNKDYCESKWLLTTYSAALNDRLSKLDGSMVSVCADPGISPSSTMWDQQTFIVRFLARYVFRFLTKSSSQAAACTTHLAVAPEIEGGGYYHSGNLHPPMRDDCLDPKEWKQMVDTLKKALPECYQKYAVETSW